MVYSLGRRFIQHEHTNCPFPRVVEGHFASQTSNYEDCKQWCLNNSRCDAFTVYLGICYFKASSCRNNLVGAFRFTTFLLDGNLVLFQNFLVFFSIIEGSFPSIQSNQAWNELSSCLFLLLSQISMKWSKLLPFSLICLVLPSFFIYRIVKFW